MLLPEVRVHQDQCDQIKIAKCLLKLPKYDFNRKMNGFDTFTKNILTMWAIWV